MGARVQEWAIAVYPRVCGGSRQRLIGAMAGVGLSPRVRGKRLWRIAVGGGLGSIPACAGEAAERATYACANSVYPRVCGGSSKVPAVMYLQRGLSPRVRGKRGDNLFAVDAGRSIPACAGEAATPRCGLL